MLLELMVATLAAVAIFLGFLLILRLMEERQGRHRRAATEEIIVRERPWWWHSNPLGPYYSHLPRPLYF